MSSRLKNVDFFKSFKMLRTHTISLKMSIFFKSFKMLCTHTISLNYSELVPTPLSTCIQQGSQEAATSLNND